MKKIIFGIFAHPDDESFGPAGTLLLEARAGTEVHLITLTAGDSGMNVDNHSDLGSVRLEEWKKAGALIGATSMHFLGYKDGTLSNKSMLEIGHKLVDLITQTISSEPEDTQVELLSMDLNGLTGHIDHIVAARSACYAFYSLQATDPRLTRIRLACMPLSHAPVSNVNWLYMEAGRGDNEIDEVVDATAERDKLLAIVEAHHTQRSDGNQYLQSMGDQLGMNYFIVKN
jgi:LmbE family N-acetylglucosaminyl deacetylase